MPRIACIARLATSRSLTRGRSPGSHRRVVPVPTTRACRNAAPVVGTATQSIASRLTEEVAAHRFDFDASRLEAAARLDRLSADLIEQTQSTGPRLRAKMRRLAAQPADT